MRPLNAEGPEDTYARLRSHAAQPRKTQSHRIVGNKSDGIAVATHDRVVRDEHFATPRTTERLVDPCQDTIVRTRALIEREAGRVQRAHRRCARGRIVTFVEIDEQISQGRHAGRYSRASCTSTRGSPSARASIHPTTRACGTAAIAAGASRNGTTSVYPIPMLSVRYRSSCPRLPRRVNSRMIGGTFHRVCSKIAFTSSGSVRGIFSSK